MPQKRWLQINYDVPRKRIKHFLKWIENFPIAGIERRKHSFIVYIPQDDLTDKLLYPKFARLSNVSTIAERNWNEEWEKNYEPVFDAETGLYIRAPFHKPNPQATFEVLIEPGLAFGTGHHITTLTIAKLLLEIPCEGKSVLDVGCGSGILGIIAAKRGASRVVGIDIDENALANAKKNALLNNISLELYDDWGQLKGSKFDLVIANIELNAHLELLPKFSKVLKDEGLLILSGIIKKQRNKLLKHAKLFNFKPILIKDTGEWQVLLMFKSSKSQKDAQRNS
ncbi:MAG: 50S ribosomal protein L11 methyltransferase [Chlorobi bacterium]|nr:50S ribosomal protein L11 methyltransferase [Chlorobiota bacterium]